MFGPDSPDIGLDERTQIVRETLTERADRTLQAETVENYANLDPDQARRLAVADTECSPNVAEIAREGYPDSTDAAFPDVTCPALVLKRDAETDRRITDLEAAESLGDGRLVHVPGAGHYVFQDEYDAAYAELRAFLGQI